MKTAPNAISRLRAAVYARKSSDDSDRDQHNKSVSRQVAHARDFAEGRGWTVAEEYTDDGISGAECVARPGLLRMLGDLKRFDVVVMSETSRLGRDMIHNAVILDQITSAGVRVFYYLTGREETMDSPVARLMVTLQGFAAEMERARCSERTRDALQRKVREGYSTGGGCFGYDAVSPRSGPTAAVSPCARTRTIGLTRVKRRSSGASSTCMRMGTVYGRSRGP